MTAKTSLTDPLQINAVAAPNGGWIGMTLCPGKWQPNGQSGFWQRDLSLDLDRIAQWGACAVVTLMEGHELAQYRVADIGSAVQALGMEWHHLPIQDFDIPRAPFAAGWVTAGPLLHAHLTAGRKILLHCLGGLGRSGTIAARLLIERGLQPVTAIAAVRAARPGAIETDAQCAYVRQLTPPG